MNSKELLPTTATLQTIYQYGVNNNLIFRLYHEWDGPNLAKSFRSYYYYKITSNIQELKSLEFSFQIFPNPNNGLFMIGFDSNSNFNGDLTIYNLLGQLIYSQAIQHGETSSSLGLSGFSEGTYFLQIKNDEQQTTQAFNITY